jgi:hypothetical protein
MIRGTEAVWRRWPRLLQRSVVGLMAVILLAMLYVLLARSPQPISPAQSLFAPVSVEQALLASRPELSSFDFIFRPVFAIKRVPPVMPLVDEQQNTRVDEIPVDEIVGSIDGVSLMGIFGSGEVAGVIIRLDNGERQRVLVGDSVKGWTLQSLGSRRAMLQAATGQRAVLEMIFATDQTPVAIEAAAPQAITSAPNATEGEPSQRGSTNDAADAVPKEITFENYYGGPRSTTPDAQE